MAKVKFYTLDVFTDNKYGGNQLAVFVDYENQISEQEMQEIAREINFAETSFIKHKEDDSTYGVRIFTPEYEVPFAGHPALGTTYIIARHLMKYLNKDIVLKLKQGDIKINLSKPDDLEECVFTMQQSGPSFFDCFSPESIASELGINIEDIDASMPIQEVSTGLPYIIVPMKNMKALNSISLDEIRTSKFLIKNKIHKDNSKSGLTTNFFFVCDETHEKKSDYNTRMIGLEQDKILEDAATGSANACFLAYLLKHKEASIKAKVEQGFFMGRKSYIQLDGAIKKEKFIIKVGGKVIQISDGNWII